MPRAVTIGNLGQAFEVVKAMQTDGLAFADDHRPLARAAPGADSRGADGGGTLDSLPERQRRRFFEGEWSPEIEGARCGRSIR